MNKINRRERALQLAMESCGNSLGMASVDVLLGRAAKIEAWLKRDDQAPASVADVHVVVTGNGGRLTPSGKRACEICGESWPCSVERRRQGA